MNWIEPPPIDLPAPLPELHPLLTRRLLRDGIRTPEAAHAFLDPRAYSPAPASQLPGLGETADRIEIAIRGHEPICVWGDFDVDGQTSTTILVQTLQDLGAEVFFHIPMRESEGHGVNLPHLQEVIAGGARLVLTCDTGISAHAAADYSREHGIDFLITDHHTLPQALPRAFAIVDPKLLPEGHTLSALSGSGVAYKLAEELYARSGRPEEAERMLDLAALGLVADLASLTGDARYLVQRGLEELRNTHRLGLQIMLQMAELTPANLSEEHIGFVLGPRLNALGRLADANPAVELFTTTDPLRARVLATQLEGLNYQRQLLCSQVTRAAEAQLRSDPSLLTAPVLVLWHPTWPGGVVGIVASRLVERYQKPTILLCNPPDGPAHGSARSVEGLNITAAIAAQADLLRNFGGHPMAAGLTMEPEYLPEFRVRLAKTVEKMLRDTPTETRLEIDDWLNLPGITPEMAQALETLAPYGPGNPKLVLAAHGLRLHSVAAIGRNQEHLKLAVTDDAGNSQTVLWWNGADEKDSLPDGRFDLAYSVRASDWRGKHQVQVELVDFRSLEPDKIEIKTEKQQVIDHRGSADPQKELAALLQQESMLVWAEGVEKKKVNGKDRNELISCETLAIWSIPASSEILQAILNKVQPRKIHIFAASDPVETPEAFLGQLAGLLKYAINRRDGKISWSGLEAATSQRRTTVRTGVEWLVYQGQINIISVENDDLVLSNGTSVKDPTGASNLWAEIQSLLSETAAFRLHFMRADKETILGI